MLEYTLGYAITSTDWLVKITAKGHTKVELGLIDVCFNMYGHSTDWYLGLCESLRSWMFMKTVSIQPHNFDLVKKVNVN